MLTKEQCQKFIARWEVLSNERTQMLAEWQDIADYIVPHRSNILRQDLPGDRSAIHKLYDSTGVHCNTILASSLHGLITPRGSPWVQLHLDDLDPDDHDARVWLDECTFRLRRRILQSNFHSAIDEFYTCWPSFGTAHFYVEEDPINSFRFMTRSISEVSFEEGPDGSARSHYATPKMTGKDVLDKEREEGWEVPERIRKVCEADPDLTRRVLHVMTPRDRYQSGRTSPDRMPMGSYWIDIEEGHCYKDSGLYERGMMTARWLKVPGEKWGVGPGTFGLADIKLLQAMQRTALQAKQLAMAPPIVVQDDSIVPKMQIKPFGITKVRNINLAPKPLYGAAIDPRANHLEIEQKIRQIEKTFHNDLLLTPDGVEKTAAEIFKRQDESTRVMTAREGRLVNELLDPMMDRVASIMARRGEFPPMPESIRARDVRFRYLSPLARAQQYGEIEGINRTIQMLLPIAQAGFVEVLEEFDMVLVARHIGDVFGVPAKVRRSAEDIAARAEQRANQQNAQMAMDGAGAAAGAAADVAKAEATAPQGGVISQLLAGMK